MDEFCEDCGEYHGEPREDWNKDCPNCSDYFTDTSWGSCQYQQDVNDDQGYRCSCTAAERYECSQNI